MTTHFIDLGSINNTITPIPPDDDYVITGGDGNNTVTLGNGTDTFTLGNGGNTLTVGDGPDQFTLGAGNNTVTTGNGNSLITVGNGNDTVTVGTGSNTIGLGTGVDTVQTGAANNTVSVSGASVSFDTIKGALTIQDGSTNRLVLTAAGTMSPVNVSGFQSYQLANGGANNLTLSEGNFARLPGGSISVTGGDSGNTVNASSLSAAHAVVISGGAGTDLFTGGAGDDRFVFTPSTIGPSDTADGLTGNNTLELAAGGTGVLNGLGTSFVNINTVLLDANALWTIGISNTAAFAGTISGFARGDIIDLTGKAATGLTYSGSTLTVQNGGATVATLTVPGQSTAAQFKLTSDGQGGTDIGLTTVRSDFNGDGKSDILWQNDDGSAAIWTMDGSNSTSQVIFATPPVSWHAIGTGDFDGDGKADILWQYNNTANASDPLNGEAAIWLMNGTSSTSQVIIATPPPSWKAIGTGDFNGDGKADILWQYNNTANASDPLNGEAAIWLMNGTSSTSQVIIATPPPSWKAIGTGDFNGDGKSDILWQYNDTANASDPLNGEAAIWLMNGTSSTSQAIIATPPPSWKAIGTGDFNGDGKADILWQYNNTANASDPLNGEAAIWLMDGTKFTFQDIVVTPPSWHAKGTADLNGDGNSDILWQNDNGQAAVWLMSGTNSTQQTIFAAPPPSWHLNGG